MMWPLSSSLWAGVATQTVPTSFRVDSELDLRAYPETTPQEPHRTFSLTFL